MAKSMWDFFKEIGLEERPKGDLVSLVRLTLIGTDEDGYRHAEYTDFSVKTPEGRGNITMMVDWLQRPNWKSFADKGMDYNEDEAEMWDWVISTIVIPVWEEGFCDLESWELTYYDSKGKPYVLGIIYGGK